MSSVDPCGGGGSLLGCDCITIVSSAIILSSDVSSFSSLTCLYGRNSVYYLHLLADLYILSVTLHASLHTCQLTVCLGHTLTFLSLLPLQMKSSEKSPSN